MSEKADENDEVTMGYFAVSMPDLAIWHEPLSKKSKVHCLYKLRLANLGFVMETLTKLAGNCLSVAQYNFPADPNYIKMKMYKSKIIELENPHQGIQFVDSLLALHKKYFQRLL